MYVRIKGRIYKVYEENGEFYIIKRIPKKERVDPLNVVHEDLPKKPKKIGVNIRPLIDSDKKLRKTVEELEKLSTKEKSLRDEFEKAKKNLILCETRNGELIELITQIADSNGLPHDDAIQALRQIRDFIKKCADEMKKITVENQALIQQITQLKRDVDTCNGRLRDCETKRPLDCKDAERTNAELREEIARLREEIDQLSRRPPPQVAVPDCSHLERTIEELRQEIVQLRANPDCSQLQDILEQSREEIEQLQEEIHALRYRPPPQVAVPDCRDAERMVEQLRQEIVQLRANPDCRQIAEKLNFKIEQLELELQGFQNLPPPRNCDESERMVRELRDVNERLQDELEAARHRPPPQVVVPDCSRLERVVEKLQAELDQLKANPDCRKLQVIIDKLQAEIEDLKNKLKIQLKDTIDFHAEDQHLRNIRAHLEKTIEEMNAKIENLIANPDCSKIVEKLEAEINNIKTNPDCKKFEKLVQQLREEIEEQRQKHMELSELYIQQGESNLELHKRWEELRDELNRRSNPPPQVAVPVPDCSGVIAQLNAAQRLIEQLRLENTPKDCDAENQKIVDLTKALDSQTGKLKELSIQNGKLEDKLKQKIPANCDEYISQIANLQHTIEQTVEENRRTVNDLRQSHEQRVQTENERADQIQSALDKLKDAHRQLQEKIPEMDRELPQKYETLRVEFNDLLQHFNDLNRNFRELEAKAAKQEQYNSAAKDRIEEIQREGEALAEENSNLHQEVRTLNSQIETTTELIKINSAQIGVLGNNRHYLLEKIGTLILECKTDTDARQILAEVMDKESEAKEQYVNLQQQISRLTGVGDPNAVTGMIFKI